MINKHKMRGKSKWLKSIFFSVALAFSMNVSNAQTYLKQDFDAAFTTAGYGAPSGSATTVPAGASGNWTQSNLDLLPGYNQNGTKYWERNTWTGTAWTGTPDATSASHKPSTGAVNGNGVLWFNFVNNGTLNSCTRRVESPSFNLSTSTSPYLTFSFYDNGTGNSTAANYFYNRAVISSDGGATWQNLSNILTGYEVVQFAWDKIYIPIPAALRTSTVKVGFEINSTASNPGSNPFIDDVRVLEYTPTTITSAQAGAWNDPNTWVGGVVPTSANNVVIAHNITVTNPLLSQAQQVGIMARCQNLTINAGSTLTWIPVSSMATNLLQVFGDISISGTLKNSTSTASDGRALFFGGNLTINTGGTLTCNNATSINQTGVSPFSSIDALIYTGAKSSSITNNGTITGGRINNLASIGSGTLTLASPITVTYGLGLYDGTIAAGTNLTIGNAPTAGANVQITRAIGQLTGTPTWSNSNVSLRRYAYLGGAQGAHFVCSKPGSIITFGNELENVSGTLTVGGGTTSSITFNSMYRYNLANNFAMNGSTMTMTNGIIRTNGNTFTIGAGCAGSTGNQPEYGTGFNQPFGSYIVGAVTKVMGTAAVAVNIPLGNGFSAYTVNSNNYCRPVTFPFGVAWASQTVRVSLVETAPTGTINAPTGTTNPAVVTALQGNKCYSVEVLSGTWPAGNAIALSPMITPSPSTAGDDLTYPIKDSLVVLQSSALSGPWTKRSVGTSTLSGNLVNYVLGTVRTTATAAPGPITFSGTAPTYFCFGTTSQVVPNAPTALAPTANAAACQSSVTLTWTHGNGSIAGYLLDLSTSPTFATFEPGYNGLDIGNTPTSTTGSYTLTNLSPNTHYYWRLVAKNTNTSQANSSYSATADFTTNALQSMSLPFIDEAAPYNSVSAPAVPCGLLTFSGISASTGWSTNAGSSAKRNGLGGWGYQATTDASLGSDQWLVFPAATFTAGTTYELQFYAKSGSATTHYFEARYATAATMAAMLSGTTIIPQTLTPTTDFNLISGTFSPATTGSYFVAIRLYQPASSGGSTSTIDEITIRQLPNVNIVPVSFVAPTNCNLTTTNGVATFTIKNAGSVAADFTTTPVTFTWNMRNGRKVATPTVKVSTSVPLGDATTPIKNYTYTLNTGTLAPGATMDVQMGADATSGGATSGAAAHNFITMYNTASPYTALGVNSANATDTFRCVTSCNSITNAMPNSPWTYNGSGLNYGVTRNTGITYTPISGSQVPTGSPLSTSVVILSGGQNYVNGAAVTFTGGGGTGAAATITTGANGTITGINFTNQGSGYTSVPALSAATGTGAVIQGSLNNTGTYTSGSLSSTTVLLTGGTLYGPSVTTASANTTPAVIVGNCTSTGTITSYTVISGGSGYLAGATGTITTGITISGASGSGAAITSIAVTSGVITSVTAGATGSGYCPITTVGGGGTGVTGFATTSAGAVTAVTLTNVGSGFTSVPTISFAGCGAGTGANCLVALASNAVPSASAGLGAPFVDNAVSAGLNIGFNFNYQGINYPTFSISSNGYISLLPANGTGTSVVPNNIGGNSPVRVIAPFWDDLAFADYRNISYQVSGTSPNRVLTVQWANATINVGSASGPVSTDVNLNFQVKLYEGTNNIEFIYGNMQGFKGTSNLAYSYSVGLAGTVVGSGATVQSGLPTTQIPTSCQMMSLLWPNTNNWGFSNGNIANEGSNALSILPESNSSYYFTAGGTYTPATVSNINGTAPSNDNVAGAITLTANATEPTSLVGKYYSSYNATATAGYSVPSTSFVADDDVWFKFNSIDNKAKIKLYSSPGYNGVMQIYNSSMSLLKTVDATIEGSQELFDSQTESPLIPLTVGQNYFVRVFHKGGGATATATATLTNGAITGVNITNGGSGYASGISMPNTATVSVAPKVQVTGGGGTGAVIVPVVTNGVITSFTILNGGTGYTSTPTITIASPKAGISGEFGIALIQSPYVASLVPDNDLVCGTNISTYILPVVSPGSTTYQTFTNANATNTNDPTVFSSTSGVWFKALIPETGILNISFSSTSQTTDNVCAVYVSSTNTCTGTLSLVASDDNSGPGNLAQLSVPNLPSGDFAYIFVASNGATPTGTFGIQVATTTPLNDNIYGVNSTQYTLPVNTAGDAITYTTGNNASATTNIIPEMCSSSYIKDVWYKAVVPNTGTVVVLFNSTSATTDNICGVFTSSNNDVSGNLTQVGCNDDGGAGSLAYVVVNGLTPGNNIYILVASKTATPTGNFGIALLDAAIWTGTTSTSYTTNTNWFGTPDVGVLPVAGQSIRIPVVTNKPIITANTTVGSITVQNGSSIYLNGGNLTYTGSLATYGTTTPSYARVYGTSSLANSTASSVDGTWIVENFTKSGATTLTLNSSSTLNIAGVLTHSAGTILTNNRLFIKSYNTGSGATALGTGQIAAGAGLFNGNVVIERKIPASTYTSQHYVSAPVSDTNTVAQNYGDDYSVIGSPYPKQYTGTVGEFTVWPTSWWYNSNIVTTNSSYRWMNGKDKGMRNGMGVSINVPGNLLIDVVGKVQTASTINVPTTSGVTFLAGNPYPSTIDLNTFLADNTSNVGGNIVYYLNGGNYISYSSAGGGISVPDNFGDSRERFMGHSQGFWINATSNNIVFKTAQRNTNPQAIIPTMNNTGTFYSENANPNIFRFRITNTSNAQFDELAIVKDANSTDGIDANDASKFMMEGNSQPYIYTSSVGQNLVINNMSTLENKEIPVGIVTNAAGVYTLNVHNSDAFVSEVSNLVLEDRMNNTFYDLKTTPSVTVTLPEGNAGNRFYLHTSKMGTTAVKEVVEQSNISVYSVNEKVVLNFGTQVNGFASVEIYNIAGALVRSINATSFTGIHEVNLSNEAAGAYLVKINTSSEVISKKVMISKN